MKIELRNIKYAAFASEETNCFEATLYVNGVRRGSVWNEGRGGPNHYDDHHAERELNEYGKTLPKMVTEYDDPSSPSGKMELEYDADILVHEAFEREQHRKDMRRDLKSRVLFTKTDGKLYQSAKLTPAQLDGALKLPNPVKDAVQILNRLPEDAALELYIKAGAA